jgi:hypothetical protein
MIKKFRVWTISICGNPEFNYEYHFSTKAKATEIKKLILDNLSQYPRDPMCNPVIYLKSTQEEQTQSFELYQEQCSLFLTQLEIPNFISTKIIKKMFEKLVNDNYYLDLSQLELDIY